MKPSSFKESTIELTKPAGWAAEDCSSLSVYQNFVGGTTVSRWVFTWRERWRVLCGRPLWVHVHAGGTTQPPLALEVRDDDPFVYRTEVKS